MPEIDELMVVRLACSKLCHDLISPVSAVNNGLELVGDSMAGDPEAMDLITSSARTAAERLQYYRVALGFSGGSGQSLSALQSLLKPFVADAKCESDWQVDSGAAQAVLTIDSAQIVLNAVSIGLDCLPRSGQVAVILSGAEPGKLSLEVDVTGPSVRVREELSDALTKPMGEFELTVRGIQATLMRMVAARLGCPVTLRTGDGHVSLTVDAIPVENGH